MVKKIDGFIDKWMDRWIYMKINGWKDGYIDKWMDRWIYRWNDG